MDVWMKLGKAGEGYFDMASFQKEMRDRTNYLSDDVFSELDNASMSEEDGQQYQVDKQSMEQVQELLEGSLKWKWPWGNFPQKNHHSSHLSKDKLPKVSEKVPQLPTQDKIIALTESKQFTDEGTGVFKSFMGILKGKKDPSKDLTLKTKQALEIETEPPITSPFSTIISPTDSMKLESSKNPLKKEDTIKKDDSAKKEDPLKKDDTINKEDPIKKEQNTKSPQNDVEKIERPKEPQSPPIQMAVVVSPRKEEEVKQELESSKVHLFKSSQDLSNDVVEISLCGHLLKDSLTEEQKLVIFEANKIVYDSFLKDPAKIVKDNNLIFKFGDCLYQKEVGLAVLFSRAIYGKDLRQEQYTQEKRLGKKSLWNRWFGSKENEAKLGSKGSETKPPVQSKDTKKDESTFIMIEEEDENPEKPKTTNDKLTKFINSRKLSEDQMVSDTSSLQSLKRRVKRSLKPNSEMLKKLGLNFGVNKITYKVHTELQGLRELTGNIFLFKNDAKIVISDVDGTITKSDVFGQLMPIMGTDWNHPGVAQLYQNIVKNGYEIIYLTARGIGQSDQTKGFIYSMQQGQIQLPLGPVIMSPDRLLPSFKREVIDKKPEVFKIQALKDIKNIFDQDEPMFAGFGNRETDAFSYQTVGIDINKIYIIDTDSQIHMVNREMITSYSELNESVDLYFPPTTNFNPCKDVQQFNAQNFWNLNQDRDSTEVDIEELFK